MADESRILRFAIAVGTRRARWWRLRAGSRNAELFLERENSGQQVHLSMHRSGEWHLDVNGAWPVEWERPPALALGNLRALSVVQHIGMAVVDSPTDVPMVLHPVPPDTDRMIATSFDVWIERPDADLDTWPGMEVGTALISRLPLAENMGTACVVADRVRPHMDSLPQLAMTADEIAFLRETGVSSFPSVAVTHDQDGTILLIERWSGIPDTDAVDGG